MQRRPERMLTRFGWPAIALAAAVLAIAAPGAQAASHCRAPSRHPFPVASGLTASHTDCATARAVVESVQAWWQLHEGVFPGWLKAPVHHHRWHCTYRTRHASARKDARCTSGRRLVTMTLG